MRAAPQGSTTKLLSSSCLLRFQLEHVAGFLVIMARRQTMGVTVRSGIADISNTDFQAFRTIWET